MSLVCLSSANCLQAFLCIIFRRGFLLGRQPCRQIWCSVRRMVWALTGWTPPLQPLQQCWQHSYVYFPNTTSGYDAEHVHTTSLVNHDEACSEWIQSCWTAVWSWPPCCSSVSGSWQSSYSLRHLYVEQWFPNMFLEPPQHCTFCMSPLSDTPISGLGVATNELMSLNQVWLIKETCKMCSVGEAPGTCLGTPDVEQQLKSSFPKRYKSILIVFMKMTFFYLDPYN